MDIKVTCSSVTCAHNSGKRIISFRSSFISLKIRSIVGFWLEASEVLPSFLIPVTLDFLLLAFLVFWASSSAIFLNLYSSVMLSSIYKCNKIIIHKNHMHTLLYFINVKKTWLLGLPSQHHDHIHSRICLFSQPYLPSSSSSAGSTMPTDHILDRWLVAPSPNIGTAKHIN